MKTYTNSELMEMTVVELRELCRRYNIVGMSKVRKDLLVNAIETYYEDAGDNYCSKETKKEDKSKVPYINANVHSFLKNDTYQTLISVSCGAASSNYPVVGRSVGFVKATYREILNVETEATGVVNGESVADTYILKSGDNLEFVRKAGSKG